MAFGSSSKSEAYDNRSVAAENAIAAGGNRGAIAKDIFGDKIFQPGKTDVWKYAALLMIAYLIWKHPFVRNIIKPGKKR